MVYRNSWGRSLEAFLFLKKTNVKVVGKNHLRWNQSWSLDKFSLDQFPKFLSGGNNVLTMGAIKENNEFYYMQIDRNFAVWQDLYLDRDTNLQNSNLKQASKCKREMIIKNRLRRTNTMICLEIYILVKEMFLAKGNWRIW